LISYCISQKSKIISIELGYCVRSLGNENKNTSHDKLTIPKPHGQVVADSSIFPTTKSGPKPIIN
jgi:hypothetical protein